MPCQMAGSKKTEALLLLLIEEAKLMLRGGRRPGRAMSDGGLKEDRGSAAADRRGQANDARSRVMPCQMAGSKKTESRLLLVEEAKLMMHGAGVMPCQMAGSKKTEAWLLLL